MGDSHHPRLGSMQYWPRKRAGCAVARIRSWAKESKVKPLGFIGYKVGMTHLQVIDNRPKSPTKGEPVFMPSTIVECPPLTVVGIVFYNNTLPNPRPIAKVTAPKLPKELGKRIQLPKKKTKSLEEVKDLQFDDLRLLVQSNPKLTCADAKKPHLLEIGLGGSKEEKLNYAREKLGQDIKISEIFDNGSLVDLHGITKGKGFQGTIKRFGAHLRQHKAEKTKRGIATLGPTHPHRILFSVPQSGKMGYHLRTEYNRQILRISENFQEVNPSCGFKHYGLVKNAYLLLKGSVFGPQKRPLVMCQSIRPNPDHALKANPEIAYIYKK